MSTNARIEVINELEAEKAKYGKIIRSNQERKAVFQAEEAARDQYEKERKLALLHRYPRYFGFGIFGGTAIKEGCEEFDLVVQISRGVVKARRVDIVTGGGTGIMEAANLGIQQAIAEAAGKGRRFKAKSQGIPLTTLGEEGPNKHLHIQVDHSEFSTRLQEFVDRTHAAYIAPGGYGTDLERAFLLQLRQVRHIEPEYLILFHPEWQEIVDTLNRKFYTERIERGLPPTIRESDIKPWEFTTNIPRIVTLVSTRYDDWWNRFGKYVRQVP